VTANIAVALTSNASGVFNIGGGHRLALNEVLDTLSDVLGFHVAREIDSEQPGDVRDTSADISKARQTFGYGPSATLRQGLEAEVGWVRDLMAEGL